MSDEPLNFEEHRKRREENASTVPCPRCKKWIVATTSRCPECGVHFQGEAQDFADEPAPKAGVPKWAVLVAILLLIAWLLTMFG